MIFLLLFSLWVTSNSLRPLGLQHARLLCPSPSPRACSNSCPLSLWCHPTISSSVIPLLLRSVFPSIRVFESGGQSIGLSASGSVLPMNIQGLISFRIWLVWSCSPSDSQESSPTPQFKSINSLVLSFLHSPTLTSIHDYWKNHSLD